MYASSSANLLLHTPQRLNARWFALIDVLISLAGGEWPGALICSVMEACKDGLRGLLEQGLLSSKPLSIPAADILYLQSYNMAVGVATTMAVASGKSS
jgi:hypothetical protein